MRNHMETKICFRCKQDKLLTEYNNRMGGLHPWCRECANAYQKKYYAGGPETEKHKSRLRKRYREKKIKEPWLMMYKGIKYRAKQKSLDFDLTPEYIKSIWTDTCPILGIPLYPAVFESGGTRHTCKAKPQTNSPTMDRIDSDKGYIKGNVCIMSYRANMIKNCGTLDEHRKIVSFLERQEQQDQQICLEGVKNHLTPANVFTFTDFACLDEGPNG